MTAQAQAIGQTSGDPGTLPLEGRTVARHLIGWAVAWWFFAKVLPIFENVHLGLGFEMSTLGSILVGFSYYATLFGPWLVPVCLLMDCAISCAAHRTGGRPWQRRWTLAVEFFLFAAVVMAMLVFRSLMAIWVAGQPA